MSTQATRNIHDYDDIINLPRPVLRRPRLSASARAAQFSPYAALVGHKDIVAENEANARTQNDFDHDIIIDYVLENV